MRRTYRYGFLIYYSIYFSVLSAIPGNWIDSATAEGKAWTFSLCKSVQCGSRDYICWSYWNSKLTSHAGNTARIQLDNLSEGEYLVFSIFCTSFPIEGRPRFMLIIYLCFTRIQFQQYILYFYFYWTTLTFHSNERVHTMYSKLN